MKHIFRRVIFILIIVVFLSPLLSVSPAAADQPTEQPEGFGWTQIGPAGGQFKQIIQNPFEPNMFFAVVGKGLYKSVDNGFTWDNIPFPDGFDLLDASCRMKIGGEDNPTSLLGYRGKIFKTSVERIEWQEVSNLSSGFHYDGFEISGKHANMIVARIDRSFVVTRDGGVSWKNVFPNPYHFAYNTTDDEQILLFHEGTFFRTDNFGDTWQRLETNVDFSSDINSLIYSESDSNYYLIHNYNTVYKSVDQGENWTIAFISSKSVSKIQVSRWNPEIILVSDDIYLSEALLTLDGGQTWKTISRNRGDGYYVFSVLLGKAPGDNSVIGLTNQVFMRINPEDQEIQRSAAGIHEQWISRLLVNPEDGEGIYACVGVKTEDNHDDRLCYYSPNTGEEWHQVGASIGSFAVNPGDFSEVYWIDKEGRLFFSSDYGATVNLRDMVFTYLPVPVFPDPHHPGKVRVNYGLYDKVIYESLDYGISWTRTEATMPGSDFVYDPIIADKAYSFETQVVGKYFVTNDDGLTWQGFSPPHQFFGRFLVRVIDGKSQLVNIVIDDESIKVYTSQDDGLNWQFEFEIGERDSYYPMDILEASDVLMTVVSIEDVCDTGSPSIKYQVDFNGDWKELPKLRTRQDPNRIQLSSHGTSFRVFVPTYDSSIYYIDFSDKELMHNYLPLILKR